jgi:hypothetical protein
MISQFTRQIGTVLEFQNMDKFGQEALQSCPGHQFEKPLTFRINAVDLLCRRIKALFYSDNKYHGT